MFTFLPFFDHLSDSNAKFYYVIFCMWKHNISQAYSRSEIENPLCGRNISNQEETLQLINFFTDYLAQMSYYDLFSSVVFTVHCTLL